ncbi:malonate decarboxylase holo-ACP synthase [Pseudomonas cremoricolorata]|uniref:Phosphoribosyl-dephospho-CoA transferase n=1 Tax=Pseudomonas cremoricolorata TaxID=157783 RepID=A0A089WMS2_9PSED|nr:malonate decarboxylase holo-ACP synthase [Pseudomonas cremoricolorata]AIR87742.1 phosphoribosyl-dephospho-CoA transferase [Pseudomonas cremoricolorata]
MNAHDLLWGMRPEHLPAEAPEWARRVLLAGRPVVVRRAQVASGSVAVGVRGAGRSERLAAQLPLTAVTRRCRPEQLRVAMQLDLPALRALQALTPLLDGLGLAWGPTGGVGYQLASAVTVLHAGSDLDLVLRTPTPWSRTQAQALLQALAGQPCRIDLQLETPNGAVALADWAGVAPRVLLKRAEGACLVENPWPVEGALA